jgi:ankyrin repeat protein
MAAGSDSGDAVKLQRHLDLLRQEYVKLQQRLAESEQKYAELAAASGQLRQDHFVSRLMRTVEELFDRKLYSDIKIKMDGQMLYGHKFVLVSRSDHWCEGSVNDLDELELPGLTYEVAHAMIRWAYTDKLEMRPEYDQDFVVKLLAAADKYQLMGLKLRCEKTLMSTVTVQNCIKLFQTATDAKANELRKYCLEMISSHWDELDTAMFADLSAPLLYEMFKDKSRYPLHLAIKHKREDVEFLFLIEYNSELKVKLNERNEDGELPIHLALITRNESIASQLVGHGCNVDLSDSDGQCLLHDAISRGDHFAARFLIENGAGVEKTIVSTKKTPLHLAASYKLSAVQEQSDSSEEEMTEVIKLMLEKGANPNAQDLNGWLAFIETVAKKKNKKNRQTDRGKSKLLYVLY